MAGEPSAAPNVIHSDARAIITPTLATLDGTSYPISAIASLRVVRKEKNRPLLGFLLIIAGLIGGLAALGAYGDPKVAHDQAVGYGLAALLMMGFGVRLMRIAPDYALLIRTAGGETAAMQAADSKYLDFIRSALEHAVHVK